MPLYRYKAVNGAGATVQGEFDAPAESTVVDWLRDSALLPLKIEVAKACAASAGGAAVPRRERRRWFARKEVGADQILECDGRWFDKPRDLEEARAQLQALSGRTHRLITAAAVVRDSAVLWRAIETARLTMRRVSEAFLDRYLAAMGKRVLATVGGYELEGLGAQLMTRVEGDYFAILGLPLLPLLAFLREDGALAA